MSSFTAKRLIKRTFSVGATLAFLCTSFVVKAEVLLSYSDHQPLDGMRTTFLNDVFFPALERESDGRIKIEKHWDGEVAISYEALATLKEGKKDDISTIVPEYTAAELPLHQIFKSFPVGPSGDDQVSLFRDIYETIPAFKQELENNNLEPIFLSTGYPAGFFSTNALENLGDLKNQKWRSASFWHLDFIKNAGAFPVRMHWGPEVYSALDNGDLDGILVNIDSAYNLKLHQTAKHALVSKDLWLGHLYIVAMNRDRFNSLSTEDKEAIKRAAAYSYRQLGKVMDESFDEMVNKLERDGANIRYLTKSEIQSWSMMTNYKDVQSLWASGQETEGVEETKTVIDRVFNLMEIYRQK